ncbi:putative chromate ion transporter [Aspergillus clavatus NRRL 1]|uniref:Chromate ion transporter, putative n=1 Tax=Aspergillus clavatus (strain ATCC 1007 / CBS 513.65 / DSM 816 / NCTC 3887 / NRRL 1 / QM 1276 / 107) TaxID=344612 RepID=A1C8F0_ASPCL|nr:chromate ion transporter, putative [Aspergillus clavatus NRRL 1]EAW13587.1 chromate ion transporter, putative [Aspergillus clavatus NRRL 1]
MQLPAPFSRYLSSLRALNQRVQERAATEQQKKGLYSRLSDVFCRTWHLGFTAFGGPPVHFQIFHEKFVEGKGGQEKWVDEQSYQELFAICQALPGPASTKMLFCLALLHAGFIPAVLVFMLWSLPGAVGMYALSLGIQNINDSLPPIAYALLSGLNASTVGIIALAAVQLAEKAIKDKLTRILVILGACAGLCYNALWYFPLLMVIGGMSTVVWDGWMSQFIRKTRLKWRRRDSHLEEARQANDVPSEVELQEQQDRQSQMITVNQSNMRSRKTRQATMPLPESTSDTQTLSSEVSSSQDHIIRIRVGIMACIAFFASFIAIMVARGVITAPPLALDLFANMYLAGTIIFGGGPVVIPLLRSYVVDPGWVSGRDFLIGLALIQAFPGPNFNLAVFLGALALQKSQFPTIFGAFLGYIGIFVPGITLAVAMQSFWRVLRQKKWVVDWLRGVNASAVGLVFTAVYRLWEIGYLTPKASNGQSLAIEPWWVVVAAVTYAENAWFKVPPPVAIIFGGILGLCWYGAVER